MIATIIDCEDIVTATNRPAIRFKIEVENEIHYVFVAKEAIYFMEAVIKHLRIPIIRKANGYTIASFKSQKDKLLPVDPIKFRGTTVYAIAMNRLNK